MTAPLEVLAFAIGIKPALRLHLARADAEREARRWMDRGASIVHDGEGHLYVARDEARARALERAEAPILPGGALRAPNEEVRARHREVGRLLGYPACCVEAYLERLGRGVHVLEDGSRAAELVVAAEAALLRSRENLWLLDFLLPRRRALVPFDPCAFDCQDAARYARALFDAHHERSPEPAEVLRARLAGLVRLTRGGAHLRVDDPSEALLEVRFEAEKRATEA